MDELLHIIRSWSARARWRSSLYWAFFGLAGGLALSLICAILARIFPIFDTTTLIALAVTSAVSGGAIAIAWPWIRASRYTPATWARRFDAQFHLKERLSTAVELREGIVSTRNEHMRTDQHDDAIAAASNVNIRRLLPFRISPRFILASLVIAVALVITIALPNPQQQVLANRAQMQQVEQEQLQQLEEAKKQVEQSKALTDDQKKQIVQALNDAEQALSDPNSTPEKALAAINDAQAKLDAVRDQTFADKRDDLQRAGQSLSPDELTNPLANALENGNFQKAADQMSNLTQHNGKPLTAEERQRVANQLDQMARNIQNTNQPTAQQLRDAAQSLRDQQDKAAQAALNQVAQTLNQVAQKQAVEQQLSETQAGIEDARRAISEAAQKAAASTQGTQQSQSSQTAAQGQKASSNPQGNPSQNAGAAAEEQTAADRQAGAASGSSGQLSNAPSGASNGQGDNAHHEDTGTDNSVMVAGRVSVPGQNVVLPDDKGKTVANPNANANANPGVSNQSSVPYQQVYTEYAKTADDAIQNGSVPSNLRDFVRDYFSSLNPRLRK